MCSVCDAFEWYHHAPLSCKSSKCSTTMRHHPNIKYPTRNALCAMHALTHTLKHVNVTKHWDWQAALHRECKWELWKNWTPPSKENSARLAIQLLSEIVTLPFILHSFNGNVVSKSTFKKTACENDDNKMVLPIYSFQCI